MTTLQFNQNLYMIISRVGSMLAGLIALPLLLKWLGGQAFSAWALLVGCSIIFYTLEAGMPATMVKRVAQALATGDAGEVSRIMNNALAWLSGAYVTGVLLLLPTAGLIANWLRLPDTLLLSAGELLIFTYFMVGLCAFFKLTVFTLNAVFRFDLVARIFLLQAVTCNLFACLSAWWTGRLDLTLFAYFGGMLLVLAFAQPLVRRVVPWALAPGMVRWPEIRSLLRHGVPLEGGALAFLLNFQLDRMLISAISGLNEVARYEVASRIGLSLNNLAYSGMSTLLPDAARRQSAAEGIWPAYLNMTRFASRLAVFLLLLPLVAAPLFLFAWIGLVGFHGTWVFTLLILGLTAHVLVHPVSSFTQAGGRTNLELRVALLTLSVNLAVTLLLVKVWGKEGAALGTGIALAIGSGCYFWFFHRWQERRLIKTVRVIWQQIAPALPVLLGWTLAATLIRPLVISSRWYMAPASVTLYAGCGAMLLWLYSRRGLFSAEETHLLAKLPVLRCLLNHDTSTDSSVEVDGAVAVSSSVRRQPFRADDLTVVIPSYGREQVLTDTIAALLALEVPPGAILVIDQTEEHEAATVRALTAWQESGAIRWLIQQPPSIPKAMNRGLLEAQTPLVLFLDDDIVPDAQLVADHLTAWATDEGGEAWCVVGQIMQPGEGVIDYGTWRHGWFPFNSDRRQFIDDVMAGNLCVDRQRAVELGGFDENFIGAAYRFESEFARRLLNAGGRILFAAAARIDHLRAERGGTRAYGHHLRTWHPYHAVGKYYFGFTGGAASALRTLLLQPLRAVRTRHHLARPWWIPVSLTAELLGICWAVLLCCRGPQRLSPTARKSGD